MHYQIETVVYARQSLSFNVMSMMDSHIASCRHRLSTFLNIPPLAMSSHFPFIGFTWALTKNNNFLYELTLVTDTQIS